MKNFDFDYAVVGSGFGGSVSALRLSEKGYTVAVIEKGKRYQSSDFPKTNWNLRKYLWAPIIKCFGIQKLTFFKNVFVLSGTGVGGGSLVYANTLLEPGEIFYNSKNWAHLENWQEKLRPHYQIAKKMLGVTKNPRFTTADESLLEVAKDLGREHTFKSVDVAVYFSKAGDEGKTVPDPFFNGEGPERAGCQFCGGCMVGCRFNSKNTLDKNYLYFAEKKGCKIIPEREVVNIEPLGIDGNTGYIVHTQDSTKWLQKNPQKIKVKGVVIAGGVLGTLPLLFRLRDVTKAMPQISNYLGHDVRTNSEALLGVTTTNKDTDWTGSVAIASGFYPDENTHVEIVRYSKGASLLRYLAVPMVDDGGFILRPIKLLLKIIFYPLQSFFILSNRRWAESTVILLVMQNLDNKMKMIRKWGFLTTTITNENKVPSYIPQGHKVARALAKKTNGIPLSAVNEILFQIPSTAHILGGCGIGVNKENGVVDKNQKLFGYENIYICDGSVIPANLGVNPSLTITAMSEFAMSKIPDKKST